MQKGTSHLEETLQATLAIVPALFEFASPSLQYLDADPASLDVHSQIIPSPPNG
jgi:hypothetical protein